MSNSLDPSQSLPERVGSVSDLSHKKRYGTREVDDSCIICNVSDISVFGCSGIDCPVWFHKECLTPEYGGNEDLTDLFCPYCWFKFVLKRSETSKEMGIEAKKAGLVYKSSDEVEESVSETLSGEEELQGEKAVDSSNEEERSAIKTFQDEDDDGTSEVQTYISTCTLKLGDVSMQECSSGIERDQVQQSECQSRRVVQLSDTSSSKERNEEDVTELIGSSLSVEMNNQQNENQSRRSLVQLSDASSSKRNKDVTEQIKGSETDKGKIGTCNGEARDMAEDASGETSEEEERVATEKSQDDEDGEETAEQQSKASTCAVIMGDVSVSLSTQESSSGIEHYQVQQNANQSRRRVVQVSDTSSSNDRNEDVTELIGSSYSGEMNNQQNENQRRRTVVQLSDTSSLNDQNEENVTEKIGSSLSVKLNNLQNENQSRRTVVSLKEQSKEDVTELISSSLSGEMNNQQKENQSRQNLVQLRDTSSSKERSEDVTEQIGSSLSVEMNNQQNGNQSRRIVVQLSDTSSSKEQNKEYFTEQISSSSSVKMNNQQSANQSRRRLHTSDTSSSNDQNEEDVIEQIGSSSSGEVNNQQCKLDEASKETAMSTTVRTLPSVFYNKQRRRVLWTSEEEETLMEGVEIFAAEAKKNIPWRKILERGATVFHESRSSSDLKDKWRSMLKAAARLEH